MVGDDAWFWGVRSLQNRHLGCAVEALRSVVGRLEGWGVSSQPRHQALGCTSLPALEMAQMFHSDQQMSTHTEKRDRAVLVSGAHAKNINPETPYVTGPFAHFTGRVLRDLTGEGLTSI